MEESSSDTGGSTVPRPSSGGPHPWLAPTLSIIAIVLFVVWAYLQMRHWKDPDADFVAIGFNILVTLALWAVLLWAIFATYRLRRVPPKERPIIKPLVVVVLVCVLALGLGGAWFLADRNRTTAIAKQPTPIAKTDLITPVPPPSSPSQPVRSKPTPKALDGQPKSTKEERPVSAGNTGTVTGPVTVQPGGAASFGQQGGVTVGTLYNGIPGRIINEQEKRDLIGELSKHSGKVKVLPLVFDPESAQYAEQLEAVFKATQSWEVLRDPKDAGVICPIRTDSRQWDCFGIQLGVHGDYSKKEISTGPGQYAINAFESAKFMEVKVLATPEQAEDTVLIAVGKQSPPR